MQYFLVKFVFNVALTCIITTYGETSTAIGSLTSAPNLTPPSLPVGGEGATPKTIFHK